MTYDSIEQLLAADESTLLELIGSYDLQPTVGIRPPTPNELQMAGRKWLAEHKVELKSLVCNSNVVRAYLNSRRKQDQVLLVAAIADLITSLITGVAGISVAVAIVKEGLTVFCNSTD